MGILSSCVDSWSSLTHHRTGGMVIASLLLSAIEGLLTEHNEAIFNSGIDSREGYMKNTIFNNTAVGQPRKSQVYFYHPVPYTILMSQPQQKRIFP